ncbi:MAG: 16S rRNA (cytosine(967)-C(5))-methyltransferase RsmB [Deltaproteobacteria bacterium]|nr:16S rRNA (cytosine(967)-C(5))-methyltransferase RsmB [Deltaproteobacteria bacterium]
MIPSPRKLALEILNRIDSSDAYADILIEEAYKRRPLKDVDKGLLIELVYGVLRWRGRIDWIISLFSSIKPPKMQRDILNILRLGAYQLLFLDRIPVSAAVNESVALTPTLSQGERGKSEQQRTKNFVNALLRAIDRGRDDITYPDLTSDPIRHIAIKYSHPEWLVRRFINEIGVDEAIRLCQADNEAPPLTIRVNTTAISREELLLRLSAAGYDATVADFSPSALNLRGAGNVTAIPGFMEGLFTIQDEASQLISFILDPQPGEKILDACAAPGGKAGHIAELMADTGEVVALDIKPKGVKKIEENIRRLGIKSVKIKVLDAVKPLPFKEGEFDRILLDAPCSGTGVLRRHPEGKWQKIEKGISELTGRQRTLIENLSRYPKPGGVMVYSVCSVLKEEGEGIVDAFLASHKDFILEPALPDAKYRGDRIVCGRGFFKVYSHTHGMDGFFAAKLKKIV